MGNITFILNVEDNRRRRKNFSTNLTRGVDRVTDTPLPPVPEVPVEPEDPNVVLNDLDRLFFGLVVRDFELEFGGDIVGPGVNLKNQEPIDGDEPVDDGFIEFVISDNDNPRVDLNSTVTLNTRLGTPTFASSVLTIGDLVLNSDVNQLDTFVINFQNKEFGYEAGANTDELFLPDFSLSVNALEFETSNRLSLDSIVTTLTVSTLSVEIGGNIGSPGFATAADTISLDSVINISLPDNMVTSEDFDA